MNDEICITKVKFVGWNQNPLIRISLRSSRFARKRAFLRALRYRHPAKISALVVHNQARIYQKAVGRVTFLVFKEKNWMLFYKKAIETGEGQTLTLFSEGKRPKE